MLRTGKKYAVGDNWWKYFVFWGSMTFFVSEICEGKAVLFIYSYFVLDVLIRSKSIKQQEKKEKKRKVMKMKRKDTTTNIYQTFSHMRHC